MEQLIGPTGSYTLEGELGEGGFGVTYRARRAADGREVVVKKLRIERLRDWKSVELFEREAAVLRTLDHPLIPDYLDFFTLGDEQAPSGFALVQEFVPGSSLEAVLRGQRRLDNAEMLAWFVQILEVCTYLHGRNPPVIHRDISPKNIMLRPDKQAVLIDFGTVQAVIAQASELSSTSAGTFGYAPPEQFVGRANATSDLFGLAMSYLAVATGSEPSQMPFDKQRVDVRKTLEGQGVDARLLLVLEQMTEPDPGRRPASAEQVLERLRPLLPAAKAPMIEAPARAAAAKPAKTPSKPEPSRKTAPSSAATPESKPFELDPIERWLEAKERLATLELAMLWDPPPPMALTEFERLATSADGSRAVIIAYEGIYLLALDTMELSLLIEASISFRAAGLSSDGKKVAIADYYNKRLHLIDLDRPGTPQIRTLATSEIPDGNPRVAVSPDHKLVAVGEGSKLALFEWESGRCIEQLDVDCTRNLLFTPDARYLVCCGDEETILFDARGGRTTLEAIDLAFSPDGRCMAMLKAGKGTGASTIVHGTISSLAPLAWTSSQAIAIKTPGESWPEASELRISPDGRWLAFAENAQRDHQDGGRLAVVVVDTTSGAHTRFGEPHRPSRFLDQIAQIGFCADSKRVIVCASCCDGRFQSEPGCALPVWTVDGQLLGSLRLAQSSAVPNQVVTATELPIGASASGFFGRLGPNPTPLFEGFEPSHFERSDIVTAALLGQPESALLEAADQARLADLNARYHFFTKLRDAGRLQRGADLSALIALSRGLTALLPHLCWEAQSVAQAAPRFGQSADRPAVLSLIALEQAAARLSARSAAEHDVLFEEMIDRLLALQQAEQQRRAAEIEAEQ
ncbi:MAG: protein kinase [Bradymonadaceae bacterium]|nr:protein kinase [Lujinxingiaceae bacterium]